MCLHTKKNSKVLTARRDIVVYKSVEKHSANATRTFHAIYFRQKYVLGQTVTVEAFNPLSSSIFTEKNFTEQMPVVHSVISRGLHSATKRRARRYGGGKNNVVLECVIPKGTKYIRGKYEEVVSLALKPIRVVE